MVSVMVEISKKRPESGGVYEYHGFDEEWCGDNLRRGKTGGKDDRGF